MAVDRHEVANSDNDLLNLLSQLTCWRKDQGLACLEVRVKLLQDGDGECSSLSSTRLGLSNNIGSCVIRSAYVHSADLKLLRTFDDWHDSPLLNSRRALESIGIHTWRQSAWQILSCKVPAQHTS